MLDIVEATSTAELATVRTLLEEYRDGVGVDLCFQDFAGELRGLPGDYAPPDGRLLLALNGRRAVGCAALRRAGPGRAEMKRLYVRPAARGLGVGRALVSTLLVTARRLGYSEIVLDTLPSMREAQRMYEQFGFKDIGPYRPNPVAGARYLGRELGTLPEVGAE